MDIFAEAWAYKLSLLPVLSAFFVFEISTIVRRITRIAYTPIYFMFFPLGHADTLYSQYFNEDDFYIGASQTPAEKNRVRKRIISISAISMTFATVINPAISGVFASIFLTSGQFVEFFWFLALVKLAMISSSLYRTRAISFVNVSGAFPYLILIYVIYYVSILRIVDVSYSWAISKIQASGVRMMFLDILDLIIIDCGLYIILAAVIGVAISYWMTDPDNIPELEVVIEPELVKHEE